MLISTFLTIAQAVLVSISYRISIFTADLKFLKYFLRRNVQLSFKRNKTVLGTLGPVRAPSPGPELAHPIHQQLHYSSASGWYSSVQWVPPCLDLRRPKQHTRDSTASRWPVGEPRTWECPLPQNGANHPVHQCLHCDLPTGWGASGL